MVMDMATNRIHKQVVTYLESLEKKTKQMKFFKELKKSVEVGANGTQKYVIKKGINKGKIV